MRTSRSFLLNLLGNLLPMLLALVSVPMIAHYAGPDRLGALGVVWALVGYFSFLDFGLSRVVTRRVAGAIEQRRLQQELTALRGFFWWWLMPALAIVALVFSIAGFLADTWLSQKPMGQELLDSWHWIALCVPVTLATNWLRGILEGMQRFARINVLRIIFGSWSYAAPAIAVMHAPTLKAMIVAIVLGRLLALIGHLLACAQVERDVLFGHAPRRLDGVRLFLAEGGWMTVSNLIGPLMVYVDRFVLAVSVSARSVAWYVTSQEIMLRTLVIPGALAGILFPKFSSSSDAVSTSMYADLYQRALRVLAALMLPLCALAVTGAYDGMRLWMGEDFALNGYRVVTIIAVGIFANAIAQLPFAWLQGTGHSRWTAQLHIVELPVYALALYLCVSHWGILGAAVVWSLRVAVDCLMLLRMAAWCGAHGSHGVVFAGMALITVLGLCTGPAIDLPWRMAILAVCLVIAVSLAWFGLLNRDDRKVLQTLRFSRT